MGNFAGLGTVFRDIHEIAGDRGMAYDVVTRSLKPVPRADLFVAGFVCKSVSLENCSRKDHGDCIADATGKTGETFSSVIRYCAKYRPRMVLCENVEGLSRRVGGRAAPINDVKAAFEDSSTDEGT